MAVFRVQLNFPFDSTLPRDKVSINPHYNGSDPQQLADALKANLIAYNPVTTAPFDIKVYDAKKAPPSYPLATASQSGTPPASSTPREVAICLSYYAQWNRPRYRGRLYLPAWWFTATVNVRPSGAIMTAALGFANSVLTKTLPAGTFWTVYSGVGGFDAQVTDIWCDDEWDTIRSRGLRATTRQTAKPTLLENEELGINVADPPLGGFPEEQRTTA